MALIAYAISKDIHTKHEGNEIGDKMGYQMQYFQNLAIKLLRRYSEDENATFELLLGRIPDLYHVTPIDIALDAGFYTFIAEKPCRKLFDRLWVEPLENHQKTLYINFSVSIILPFLSPLLMNFAEESKLLANEVLEIASEENEDFIDQYSVTEHCCISLAKTIFDEKESEDHPKHEREPETQPETQSETQPETQSEEENSDCLTCCLLCLCGPILCIIAICPYYLWLIRCFMIAPVVRFIYYAMIQTISAHVDYLDKWNVLDISGLLLFLVGFIIRMSDCSECLYTARIVFAFSLMVFILRTLQLLSVDTRLGPKIYMMGSLLRDLISFMLILAVFVVAYGVGSNIILYPNQPIDIYLLKDIFYDSWWSALGQPNREDMLGYNCPKTNDSSNITEEYCSSKTDPNINYTACKENKCPSNSWVVAILLVAYAIITVVMMLNILIAMFNDTYSSVQQKRNEVYNLQRYLLMREYCTRTAYPAPLCVITYWRVIPWLIQKCKRVKDRRNRRPILMFSRKLSTKAQDIEAKYITDDSDKVTEVSEKELSDFKEMVSKLGRENFNRAQRIISTL